MWNRITWNESKGALASIAMGGNEASDAKEDPAGLPTEDFAFLPTGNHPRSIPKAFWKYFMELRFGRSLCSFHVSIIILKVFWGEKVSFFRIWFYLSIFSINILRCIRMYDCGSATGMPLALTRTFSPWGHSSAFANIDFFLIYHETSVKISEFHRKKSMDIDLSRFRTFLGLVFERYPHRWFNIFP